MSGLDRATNVGMVVAKATQNAGGLEQANQQGAETSAYDVWTHTYDGMSERLRNFADDPVGALNRYDQDLDKAVATGLSGPWHHTSPSAVADSIAHQAGGLGDMVQAIQDANGALATVGATFALLTGVEQMISTVVSVIPFPALPALRIMDMDVGMPHAHAHPPNLVPPAPPVPLPSTGPIIPIPILSGATRTLINGMPAGRCGDLGLGIWCGGYFPMYEVFLGSSSVWIEGARAGRLAVDITKHCILSKPGGDAPIGAFLGMTIMASTNVLIGGVPMPSLLSLAMAALLKGLFKGLGKAGRAFERSTRSLRERLFRNMKPGFLRCIILRAEPVNILTGEVAVEQDDFALPGRIPIEWIRTYSSGSRRSGSCGFGWECLADIRLEVDSTDGVVSFRHPTEGPLFFARLPIAIGEEGEEIDAIDGARLSDGGSELLVRTKADRVYQFPKTLMALTGEGNSEYPVGRVSDFSGNFLQFERRGGHPTAITESSGRRLEIVTDRNRIIEVALWGGQPNDRHVFVRYEYDEAGDLVAVIDAMGNPSRFEYVDHHLVRHTDRRGLSFYYEYEAARPVGWRVARSWGDGGLYDYSFAYDHLRNERRITDSQGHLWLITLDERGLPVRESDPLDGVTMYEYDAAGRTTAVVDPGGRRTDYAYDRNGNLLSLTRADGSTVVTEFDPLNKPAVVVDPNGGKWERTWDARGLLLEEISPLGAVSRFEYDDDGLLSGIVDPRGGRTDVQVNAEGLVTVLTDALGNRTRFSYDRLGNLVSRTDALNQTTTFTYDPSGRLLTTTRPSGATSSCAYDAENNLIAFIDEAGAETRYAYFGLGELARRTEPDGSTVEYMYDTEERLVAVRNQRSEEYRFSRDAIGRIVEEVDFWGQARQYSYDAGDNLRSVLDPLGGRITYTYDPLGRMLKRTLPEGREETFAYDRNGNLLAASNGSGTVTRRYDAEDRLVQEVQGDRFTIEHAYDAGGNRTLRKTTLGNTVTYGFDALDQLIEVRINGREPIRIDRDPVGQIAREKIGTALTRRYSYDADGLLAEQTVLRDQKAVFGNRYWYDRASNLTRRSDTAYGLETFRYDTLGRIVDHLRPENRLIRYFNDPANDRLATRVVQHETPPASDHTDQWRRVGDYRDAQYRFDRAGNLVSELGGTRTLDLVWDTNNRLISSRTDRAHTVYQYDPFGRRVSKETDGTRTLFFWDDEALAGETTVPSPIDTGGEHLAREHVFYPDSFEPLARIDGAGEDRRVLYYSNDANGCPTRMIDSAGKIQWAATYHAWGEVASTPVHFTENPLRFQGQYYDAETGLHYNLQRYFHPLIGQFVSQDPLGLRPAENLYQYAPNALGWIDPLGLRCWIAKRLSFYRNQARALVMGSPTRTMTPGQLACLARLRAAGQFGRAAALERAFIGQRMDVAFRRLVTSDPALMSRVGMTPYGRFGPDVFSRTAPKWWDLTTRRAWPRHVSKYGPGGRGVFW